MIVPTHVDVLLPRKPYANYFLIGSITVVSLIYLFGFMPQEVSRYFIARHDYPLSGYFLSAYLHLDFMHLLGNMAFQWVFGNAVCSKIGNWRFLILYFVFEFASSLCHVHFSLNGVIGASGAINGIIGFYFALYPSNYIYVFYWFYISPWGHTRVPGYVLIIFWFIMDAWGALTGGGFVAYWAHLGGFAAGMVVAIIFLKMKWVHFHKRDHDHLFQKFFGRFNLDEITPEMVVACQLLGDREVEVRLGVMDEVKYPASILYRMMETGKAKGDDEILNAATGKWETFAVFFGHLCQSPEMISMKNKAVADEVLPQEKYFVHRDGENFGPYKVFELKTHVANGQIGVEELICEAETHNWMKVKDVI